MTFLQLKWLNLTPCLANNIFSIFFCKAWSKSYLKQFELLNITFSRCWSYQLHYITVQLSSYHPSLDTIWWQLHTCKVLRVHFAWLSCYCGEDICPQADRHILASAKMPSRVGVLTSGGEKWAWRGSALVVFRCNTDLCKPTYRCCSCVLSPERSVRNISNKQRCCLLYVCAVVDPSA